MSGIGPPYPHPNPAPGSNAIGSFVIGVSPIGTISQFDVWTTIISQYANSDILTGMINAFNAAMDLTHFFDNFFDMIWNIVTAQGYGLDVWGRIVNASRTVSIPGSVSYLGFQEAGAPWTGFGQGGFYSGGGVSTNYVLSDDDYRRLILAKAASNISDGSILSMNAIMRALFPFRGDCYVVDHQDMTIGLYFVFALTPPEVAMLQLSGTLPIPAGVAFVIQHVPVVGGDIVEVPPLPPPP